MLSSVNQLKQCLFWSPSPSIWLHSTKSASKHSFISSWNCFSYISLHIYSWFLARLSLNVSSLRMRVLSVKFIVHKYHLKYGGGSINICWYIFSDYVFKFTKPNTQEVLNNCLANESNLLTGKFSIMLLS